MGCKQSKGSKPKLSKRERDKAPKLVLTLQGHEKELRSASFSPSGEYVATASADSRTKVWDVATGQCTHTVKHGNHDMLSCAWAPDSRRLGACHAPHQNTNRRAARPTPLLRASPPPRGPPNPPCCVAWPHAFH